ncbi:MAG: metallophosphoesterase family protein [Candidatus Brocadiia bacterium]
MRLLHISDTHFGSESHFNPDALKRIAGEVHSDRYDAIIHSGDLTQSGSPSEYEEAMEFFRDLDMPCVMTAGNHDARSGGHELFEQYAGSPQGVKTIGDAVIIYVDSAAPDTNEGRLGQVKFNMIREALHRHHNHPIKIVVFHHHIIPIPRAGRERNVLANAGDLLELFLRFDVDLVLSGHRHYPNVYQVENTVIANAGTVTGSKTRFGDVNSYNVVDIRPDSISIEIRRLNGECQQREFSRQRRRIFYEFGDRQSRIVHISNSFISRRRCFLTRRYERAVEQINEMDADVVVHCGGVVEEGILPNYDLARKRVGELEPPVVYTPAARDLNYLGYHLFPRYFGPIDQHWSNECIFLQGKCSSQYDSPTGVLGPTERSDLFERVEERPEPIRGVFLHHHLVPVPHARERGQLEDAGDLLREAVDQNLSLVLTGTSSHAYAVKVGNTLVVNANSLSSVYQRSTFGHSFNVIDVYEKAIAVSEINSLWGTRRVLGMWSRPTIET